MVKEFSLMRLTILLTAIAVVFVFAYATFVTIDYGFKIMPIWRVHEWYVSLGYFSMSLITVIVYLLYKIGVSDEK